MKSMINQKNLFFWADSFVLIKFLLQNKLITNNVIQWNLVNPAICVRLQISGQTNFPE